MEPIPQLMLFIAGDSARYEALIQHLHTLVRDMGWDEDTLQIIDVFKAPAIREKYDIFVTPTLIHDEKTGTTRLVGDIGRLSSLTRLMAKEPGDE